MRDSKIQLRHPKWPLLGYPRWPPFNMAADSGSSPWQSKIWHVWYQILAYWNVNKTTLIENLRKRVVSKMAAIQDGRRLQVTPWKSKKWHVWYQILAYWNVNQTTLIENLRKRVVFKMAAIQDGRQSIWPPINHFLPYRLDFFFLYWNVYVGACVKSWFFNIAGRSWKWCRIKSLESSSSSLGTPGTAESSAASSERSRRLEP